MKLFRIVIGLLVLGLLAKYAHAADVKISALPSGGTIQTTDQVAVNRAGTTNRVVVAFLATVDALSGDCTTPGSSGVLTCGTAIARTGVDINTSNQVTVTHLAAPLPATQGGTGQTTITLGDLIYGSAANVLSKLAGNTASTIQFLSQTGTGAVSAAPVWNAASGTGNVVLSTSATLVTPALGTPSALVLTNATGLPDGALSANVPLKNAANTFSSASTQTFTGQVTADKFNATAATSSTCPTNGMYLPAGNTLGFCSNGTERYRVTSVGITSTGGGFISGGTKFTASGCSNSTTVGGATAGTFASGTTGTCTVTITLPTAPTGWVCHAGDLTTPANAIAQSASTTTSCTITGTTVTGDTVNFMAMGF